MLLSDCDNIKHLYAYFRRDDKKVVQSLQEEGFLRPLKRCGKSSCRTMQSLAKNTTFKGNYAAYCKKCKRYDSLCAGTFFDETHISFEAIFIIMWFWICHVSPRETVKVTGITRQSVIRYYRHFRDIASWKILQMPRLSLGGNRVIVQINESAVSKGKSNKGSQYIRTTMLEKWVLAIYDSAQQIGVVLYVEKRDKATLVPVIREHVKEGSDIWTNGWAAYKGLEQHGYQHHVVNHSCEFKGTDATRTNGVEQYWSRLKQFCRHAGVLRSQLMPEQIDEFMYRQQFSGETTIRFRLFLGHVKEMYPA